MRDIFKNFLRKDSRSVDDLGLGSSGSKIEERMMNRDGSFNLERRGEQNHIYHILITMSWWKFFGAILVFFTVFNGFFAFLYLILGVENIANLSDEGFLRNLINLFHFSVQTMTTVGYGYLHPVGIATNIVASIQALMGLLIFAFATGLVYGRFSNPQADIKYSSKMLIFDHPKQGKTIQIRLANRLSHDLLQADARILMLQNKVKGNKLVKEYKELKLELNHIYFLPLNWTLVHKIDKDSPLFNMSIQDMKECNVEFMVLVSAFDDTFSQTVHSRHSYNYQDVLEGYHWKMAYSINNEGKRVFDINLLDEYQPVKENQIENS